MVVKLICKEVNRIEIETIMEKYQMVIDDHSDILIIDENLECEGKYKLIIRYQAKELHTLCSFLDGIKYQEIQSNMIIGKDDGHYVPITIQDVVFFHAIGNNVYANLQNEKSYKIQYKLYQLEQSLLSKYFIRTNKSEIVNIKKIKQICPMLKGNLLIYLEGYKAPYDISRTYTKEFKERLGLK